MVRAVVWLRSPEDGGRKFPVGRGPYKCLASIKGGFYPCTITCDKYLCPGDTADAEIVFPHSQDQLPELESGMAIVLCEGKRVIGFATVNSMQ